MTFLFSGLLGGLGLLAILSRRSLLGLLVGIQLLIMGAAMAFVLGGISTGNRNAGHVFAFFITLSGVAQLVSGYTLSIRMFYLKRGIRMDQLREMKE
jgi:NADH-quinone oxidoreductase subunit K